MVEREGPLVTRAPRGPSHACQAPVPGQPLPGGLGCSAMKSVGPAASIAGFELQLFRGPRDIEEVTASLHASFSSSGKQDDVG